MGIAMWVGRRGGGGRDSISPLGLLPLSIFLLLFPLSGVVSFGPGVYGPDWMGMGDLDGAGAGQLLACRKTNGQKGWGVLEGISIIALFPL